MKKAITNSIEDYSIFSPLTASGYQNIKAIARPSTNIPGVSGFLFDIDMTASLRLQSEITDHYLEDNTAIQDHIALKPEVIVLSGKVGELVLYSPPVVGQLTVLKALPTIESYKPLPTPADKERTMTLTTSLASSSKTALASYQDIYGKIDKQDSTVINQSLSRQNYAVNYFYQLWRGRMVFSVETPWGMWTDMCIQSFDPTQDEDTNEVTEISITFKKIRFTTTAKAKNDIQLTDPKQRAYWQGLQQSQSSGMPVQQKPKTNAELAKAFEPR